MCLVRLVGARITLVAVFVTGLIQTFHGMGHAARERSDTKFFRARLESLTQPEDARWLAEGAREDEIDRLVERYVYQRTSAAEKLGWGILLMVLAAVGFTLSSKSRCSADPRMEADAASKSEGDASGDE